MTGLGQGERRAGKGENSKTQNCKNGTATKQRQNKMGDKILEICVYYPPPNPSIRFSPIDIHNSLPRKLPPTAAPRKRPQESHTRPTRKWRERERERKRQPEHAVDLRR
ncbi:hypothetical protein AOQ84DRAFT_52122 [Glonium stellatum]|uniref:Uncharacterized protein n=1 Tax=Glonium stellatum TaxID=574774 RepID=A0A8E2F055_9PEZI|nr:hypothetical protein AOQ84DRAFT_52122 [Glonium stellatum]